MLRKDPLLDGRDGVFRDLEVDGREVPLKLFRLRFHTFSCFQLSKMLAQAKTTYSLAHTAKLSKPVKHLRLLLVTKHDTNNLFSHLNFVQIGYDTSSAPQRATFLHTRP